MDMTTFRLRRAAAVTKRVGQQAWTTPGIYQFPVPMGVTSICGVAVPGGQGGAGIPLAEGGDGGDLRYINNFPVTPGEILTIEVGAGGPGGVSGSPYIRPLGGVSVIRRGSTICLRAAGTATGIASTPIGIGPSGGVVGGGDGGKGQKGPSGFAGAGGGAGGYSGAGGNGGTNAQLGGMPGIGGAGGGAARGSSGGGVGIMGQGSDGAAGTTTSPGGKGGSGGGAGDASKGGLFGGGGNTEFTPNAASPGGDGAVRIIWGYGRSFPSTRTADEFP